METMERSSSIQDESRYISSSGPGKQNTRQGRGEKRGNPEEDYAICVQDERQDQQTTGWTYDGVATQVHNLFCQAPCFVNTSTSMDNGNPPDQYNNNNNRMEPPSSLRDLNAPQGDAPAPPSAPIRFPSIHLDVEDWGGSGEDDSGFFQPTNGNPASARLSRKQNDDKEAIYRKRSSGNSNSLFPYFSRHKASFANITCSGSHASTVNTAGTSKYGLHRSPAWSTNEESDDDSMGVENDWVNNNNGTGKQSNHYRHNQYNKRNAVPLNQPGHKAVIDVTNMEEDFNDMSLLGRSGSGKR